MGAVLAVASLFAAPAFAQPAGIAGQWSGEYDCAQGETGLNLVLSGGQDGNVTGIFHFYPVASNPNVPEGCYTVSGTFDPATGRAELDGVKWLKRPRGYIKVGMRGRVESRTFSGRMRYEACTNFRLTRGPATHPLPAACARGLGHVAAIE